MNLSEVTLKLKKELWKVYGDPSKPAEWDGNIFGGGKLSQRYWEYAKTIEYLNLDENSVLLDIGGGSNTTGFSFFASLVSKYIKEVYILDPNIEYEEKEKGNIKYLKEPANYDKLKEVLSEIKFTHVSCISVFEHIPDEIRNGIIKGVDEFFEGDQFVATLEYHPKKRFFEYQLTAKSLSELFSNFKQFYIDDYQSSPVLCENAFKKFAGKLIPRWYPVAFKFLRA